MSKVKKPFYKRVWFWVLAVIAVIVFMVNAAPDVEPTTSEPVKQDEVKPAPKKNNPGISKAEFEAIKDGMSYEEVVKIVGGPGELQAESGKPGEELYTVSYMFKGEKGIGANAQIMFQGDKMNMKAQAGLK
jgi:hypothetical protein